MKVRVAETFGQLELVSLAAVVQDATVQENVTPEISCAGAVIFCDVSVVKNLETSPVVRFTILTLYAAAPETGVQNSTADAATVAPGAGNARVGAAGADGGTEVDTNQPV
jgi:hypothetical protein